MTRLLLAAAVLLGLALPAAAAERRWLITPEEAAAVNRRTSASATVPTAAPEGTGAGPLIVVKTPKLTDRVHTPVTILVNFEPGASGLAPDMTSLSVTLRGFISIDITDRLREYLKGRVLDVEGADLPTGTHHIRMAVSDAGGNLSARDVTLQVTEAE